MRARNVQLAITAVCLIYSLFYSLPAPAQAAVARSSHVVLLIDENTSYSTTLADMPYLVSQGSANGHTTNYVSDTSGSLMDYLWLASGSCHSSANCALPAGTHDFGCTGNDCTSPITDDNIFREMNNRGISWKVYAQSYAAAGGTVTTPDLANGTHYYRRHNGATWYSDILSNVDGSQAKIVDFSHFATDLANNALPQFTIIAPDGLNDGHDSGPGPADTFLKNNLPALLAKPYFQPGGDGLLIITFDNGNNDAAGLIYTAVIGPNVIPHSVSNTLYHHQNTLRTVLDALDITTELGAAASVTAMNDFFSASASGFVTITSPTQNATTGTQVLVSATATEPNASIDQLQVWDSTTGQKLGESAPGTSTISQTYSLATGAHQIIVEDISTGNFQVLHKASVNITVQTGGGDGVTITSPAPNATTGTQVVVSASATESSAQIYQLQVWDSTTGQKLGESAPGTSSINQTYSLAPGTHQIIVEDLSTGSFQVLHKSSVTINVSAAASVTISAPANNSTVQSPVLVSASTTASTAIDRLEVWDTATGTKLGDSFGSTVDTAYSLPSGQHTILVQAISTSNTILAKSQVNVTVN